MPLRIYIFICIIYVQIIIKIVSWKSKRKNSYIHVQTSYHVPALKDKDKKTSQELQMMSSVTVIVRSGGNFFSKIVKYCQKV